MPRNPRQEQLNWWLLKEVKTRDDILGENAEVSEHVVPALTTQRTSLFVRSTPPHPPRWLSYLDPHVRTGLANLYAASSGAVLVVEAAGRVFAVTFGQGRHLINTAAFESDFGLRVVINMVMPDQLKSVDAKTVEENTLHTRREISQHASLSAFGLDVSRDLVRAVTGRPSDDSLGSWIHGSDSLGMKTSVQVPELPALGARLLEAYQSDAYKAHKHFDFIDFLRAEKDPAVRAELESLLVGALCARDLGDIHLAAPEPLDWGDMEGFRFSTQPSSSPVESDPRITTYLGTKGGAEIAAEDLSSDRMFALSSSTGFPQASWPVFDCVVYQVEHDGRLYVLSGGDWFRVNLEFKARVYDEVERFTSRMEGLPDADHGTDELEYNKKLAAELDAVCLDRKFVFDGGPDRMEICDILTRTGGFLHVKHRGSSSTLSHLFAQGINSAERLLQDDDFRAAAREIAAAANAEFAEVIPDGRPDADGHEIVFVVITRSRRETPLTLPFFSVVSLRSAALRLRAMGFRVSVAAVKELPEVA